MSTIQEISVPDIGEFKEVLVIEVLVKVGDVVRRDTPLLTLETDKATMDVPAPAAGTITALRVSVGDRVSKGSPIVQLDIGASAPSVKSEEPASPTQTPVSDALGQGIGETSVSSPPTSTPIVALGQFSSSSVAPTPVRASPGVRKSARELGIDLSDVAATGLGGRVTREDLAAHSRTPTQSQAGLGIGIGLPPWPQIDHAQFGPVERKPLSRLKRIAGANLARNWMTIPHVTNFDEADITELEAFRSTINGEQSASSSKANSPTKLTMLAFLMKASVVALQRHPTFNASLDGDGLIYKHYFHIGFAADTPDGLVVPVIRDVDRKGVLEIAREAASLAALAREGKLKLSDMQGGCFTVSSLGGIGGTGFTPIINAPEVAILGVTKAQMKPVWDGKQFAPRLILPLGLSWDHRVIDGAAAARFLVDLAALLGDFRRTVLLHRRNRDAPEA